MKLVPILAFQGNSYAAVKHSEVAAEKGSSIAALRLAQRYEKGDGVQRDYEVWCYVCHELCQHAVLSNVTLIWILQKSFYYYQQAMSFGDPTGAGKVAHCYELGKGGPRWREQYNCERLLPGFRIGVEQNVDIAGTLYKQLVKRSNAEDWVVYRSVTWS